VRELVVLGTASQVPTRERAHNGCLLRWDGEGFLFDPGEGSQRQLSLAGATVTEVTRLCLTHFHGDHCLGVPGIVQRLSLDGVPHEVTAHYPRSGAEYFARLRHASVFHEIARLREEPLAGDGVVAHTRAGTLLAHRLDHPVEAYGYRLVEPDGRRILPDRLAALGVHGPDVGRLQREGRLDREDGTGTVLLDDVSEARPGQSFAFVMDTRLCAAVHTLAEGVDLLVTESTYLDVHADLAHEHGHLTAGQAGRVAAACGVRTLVLTHFSRRYPDPAVFGAEAAQYFDGAIVVAHDLARVPVPRRS